MYNNCVNKMLQDKYIVEILAKGPKKVLAICNFSTKGSDSGSSSSGTYINRRIDLLLTLPSEFYYSLLYFTGSQQFNVKMRSRALELGYSLNEHCISSSNSNSKKLKDGEIPIMKSEKDIFDFLKLEYVKPEDRK
jgi:DNA polymerase/3'-5' exonuclease PolX